MLQKKKSFILYADNFDFISALSIEDRGVLLTAIFEYQIYGEVSIRLPPAVNIAYLAIKSNFLKDEEKYNIKVNINRENGLKGGRPKKQTDISKTEEKQKKRTVSTKPKKSEWNLKKRTKHDNDNDNDNDIIYNTPLPPLKEGEACASVLVNEIETSFSKFFEIYPKKMNRKKAFEEWYKLNPSKEEIQLIISALKVQKLTENWNKEGGKYIPLASKWLSEERWKDEVSNIALPANCPRYGNFDVEEIFKRKLEETYGKNNLFKE